MTFVGQNLKNNVKIFTKILKLACKMSISSIKFTYIISQVFAHWIQCTKISVHEIDLSNLRVPVPEMEKTHMVPPLVYWFLTP